MESLLLACGARLYTTGRRNNTNAISVRFLAVVNGPAFYLPSEDDLEKEAAMPRTRRPDIHGHDIAAANECLQNRRVIKLLEDTLRELRGDSPLSRPKRINGQHNGDADGQVARMAKKRRH
jgi:hypothetical protein